MLCVDEPFNYIIHIVMSKRMQVVFITMLYVSLQSMGAVLCFGKGVNRNYLVPYALCEDCVTISMLREFQQGN